MKHFYLPFKLQNLTNTIKIFTITVVKFLWKWKETTYYEKSFTKKKEKYWVINECNEKDNLSNT